MRSRNTLLLLVFLVLAGIAAYFFLNKNDSKSTLNLDETAFSVADTAAVDKIFISNTSGKSNTLTRKPGNNWVINDRYEARKDLVYILLETMKRMEVKRPVDKATRNSVIRDMAALGRKVEVYQHGKLAKTFFVGQTTDDNLGTYFIMEGSEEPFVLHIPGFEGFLNTRFDLDETKWQSVAVFRSTAATINKLELKYAVNPTESFSIEKQGGQFQIPGIANVDQEAVKAYLDNYKFINGEYFIPNPQNRISDSLALQKPIAQINLVDSRPEQSINLQLFGIPENGDRMVALNPKTKQIISVQTFVLNRLMIRKDGFVKK